MKIVLGPTAAFCLTCGKAMKIHIWKDPNAPILAECNTRSCSQNGIQVDLRPILIHEVQPPQP